MDVEHVDDHVDCMQYEVDDFGAQHYQQHQHLNMVEPSTGNMTTEDDTPEGDSTTAFMLGREDEEDEDEEDEEEEDDGQEGDEEEDDEEEDDELADDDVPLPPPKRARRRRLLKKHPNAPKRNKTAYIIFTEAKRQEIKATLPPDAQSVADVMRAVAEVWKKMTDEDKKHWKEEEEKERQKYRVALEDYIKNGGPLKTLRRVKGNKAAAQRLKKAAGAPKRAPSAFLIWCKDRRRQLKAENPKMANIDISKMLGDEWRTLSDEAKAPFKAQAQQENEEYKQQMRQWHRGGNVIAAPIHRHGSKVSIAL